MTAFIWTPTRVVLAIHDEQLAEHGGRPGLRDVGLLESALARPHGLVAYARSDICRVAAAYAFGVVRNHPFVDGNKRTSLVTAALFLSVNRYALVASDAEKVATWLALAAGEVDEGALADWLRPRAEAQSPL